MKILKNFAVLEGGDGSGTSTQLEMLKETFAEQSDLSISNKTAPAKSVSLYSTFEPTDGPIGRLIRSGLKAETPFNSETIAFLFAADRNEHVYSRGGIEERSNRGDLVVCDRYILSSLVYQGITCGEELPLQLNSHFPYPELLIFFDLDPEIAQKRIINRQEKEIYDSLEFQKQVRQRYKALLPRFEAEGSRIEIIEAQRSKEEVAQDLWRVLSKMPIFKG